VAAWAVNAPVLIEMTRVGEISALSFLLLIVAVISLAIGGLRVQFGRTGRISFGLHIALAGVAAVMMHVFPRGPFVLGIVVATIAFAWSFASQRAIPSAAQD
jgi:hypothetical protein